MDKKSVLVIISDFRKTLQSKGIRINKLVLFGSCATGRNNEDSDIDIIVISEDFETMDYWERIDVLSSAIYEIFEPIEAVAMTPEEWESGKLSLVDYAKDGKIVYG